MKYFLFFNVSYIDKMIITIIDKISIGHWYVLIVLGIIDVGDKLFKAIANITSEYNKKKTSVDCNLINNDNFQQLFTLYFDTCFNVELKII